jgi:hypothetical protein
MKQRSQKNWLITTDNTKGSFTLVAKVANMSTRTVVDVFVAPEKLSQGTIEKVLAIVKKLGYIYSNTPPTMKKCNNCNIVKPLNEYTYKIKQSRDYRYAQSRCKDCESIRKKQYKYEPSQQSREKHRFKKYGLTENAYQNLILSQNNLCAICDESSEKSLYIDHDHKTGKVRGLLCSTCNTGLGFFRDDSNLLNKAINYLSSNTVKD